MESMSESDVNEAAVHLRIAVIKIYSIEEASKRLGLSKSTIRRRIGDGTMPHHRVGKLIRFTEEDLNQYIQSTAVPAMAALAGAAE
jgi:excisionase family DNA binding protein